MEKKLDRRSKVPLYKQVKRYIIDLVENKLKGETNKLPPEVEIGKKFGISRATVRIAILDLVKEGILERVPGKGTFVKEIYETLMFTTWLGLEEPSSNSLDIIVKDFFEEYPNTNVEVIGIPYEKTEYQLMALALGGKAPDVATLIYFWIPIFAHHGAFYPLDEVYTPEIKDNLFPQTINAVSYGDHIYGFNWINAPNILYFNKQILDEYLAVNGHVPDQYDELLEYFIKIHEKSKGKIIPFSIPIEEDEIFFLIAVYNILLSFGGGVIDDTGEIIFNSEANIKAYNWLKRFIEKGHINTSFSIRKNRRLFANNKITFFIDGPWLKNFIPILNEIDSIPMRNFGFTTLPKVYKGISYSILWNHTLSVFRQCENKELAIEFIKYLAVNRKNSELYYKETGMLPVMRNELENNPVYQDKFGKVLRKQMETALPIPASHPAFLLSITFCAKASREILLGDVNIKSTLNNCTEVINELYKR